MRCQICGRKIRKYAYKWLGRIYCYKCFEKERDKHLWDMNVDWDYEMINVEEYKTSSIKKLTDFMGDSE